MEEIACSRGGRCLSTEYVNVETHLRWQCAAGHRWTATPASIRSGKWCPFCVHNQKLELKAMRRLARRRGGKCLSPVYINNRQPLLWECKRGHRWKAAPTNVKGGKRKRGTWCLECYNLRRRGKCRSEHYINKDTPSDGNARSVTDGRRHPERLSGVRGARNAQISGGAAGGRRELGSARLA
jgi:hypothetical protein